MSENPRRKRQRHNNESIDNDNNGNQYYDEGFIKHEDNNKIKTYLSNIGAVKYSLDISIKNVNKINTIGKCNISAWPLPIPSSKLNEL